MQPDDPKQDFAPPTETSYFTAPVTSEQPEVQIVPEEIPSNQSVDPQPTTLPAEPTPPEDVQPEARPKDSTETEPVRWQAAEYQHYEKKASWFFFFGAVVIILIVVAVFVIKSWTFAVLIPVMAIAMIVFTNRQPRQMDYALSNKGLYINDTLHNFSAFKAFGVVRDDDEYSIMLIPVRRFQPGITIYFPEEVGESIVDILGVRLPMQPLKLDVFDKIVRALRM